MKTKRIKNIPKYNNGIIQTLQFQQSPYLAGPYSQVVPGVGVAPEGVAQYATTPQPIMQAPAWQGPSKGKIALAKANNVMGKTAEVANAAPGLIGAVQLSRLEGASVSSAFNGMAAGASMGAALGPWGAAAGALGGLIAGTIGKKTSVDVISGDIDKGSGLANLFQSKKKKRAIKQQSIRIKDNNLYTNAQDEIQLEFAQEYQPQGISLVANGGIIPNSLAYLDDGEVVRTPQGELLVEPEEGKPQDSNLESLPVGSQVWSDKLKVKGTNMTYADMSKKIIKKYKTKGTGSYAETTKMLNDKAMHKELDALTIELETSKKGKRGNRKMYPAHAKGTGWVNDLIGTAGAIGGSLGNITAKAEKPILRTVRPKFTQVGYNIDPLIKESALSSAIARYNLAQLSPTTGAGMQFGIQAALNRDKAIADAYALKYNMEQQQRAANTAIYNQFADRNREYMHQYDIEDALNRAAARKARVIGYRDLGTAMQTMTKDKRLMNNDLALWNAMKDFLSTGMLNERVEALNKAYNNR